MSDAPIGPHVSAASFADAREVLHKYGDSSNFLMQTNEGVGGAPATVTPNLTRWVPEGPSASGDTRCLVTFDGDREGSALAESSLLTLK